MHMLRPPIREISAAHYCSVFLVILRFCCSTYYITKIQTDTRTTNELATKTEKSAMVNHLSDATISYGAAERKDNENVALSSSQTNIQTFHEIILTRDGHFDFRFSV